MKHWENNLRGWESRAIEKYLLKTSGNPGEDIKSDCMDQMQQHWPGNYDLVWAKDSKDGNYHLDVRFHTPADETMFLLRWS